MEWTVKDIPRLDNKTIIVTGGNSGLGYEDVKAFASKGAKVIMACRSLERGKEAANRIKEELSQEVDIQVMKLDLASLESIADFCDEFLKENNRLDILMNNAGIMTTPYGLTEDGFEQQFGVNHLGHFALTAQLFDIIKQTKGARIVNISSNAHKSGVMNFYNLMYKDGYGYSPMRAYAKSKLANLYFTYELQRKINHSIFDIKVLAAHPGISNTSLSRHLEESKLFDKVGWILEKTVQSAYDGALSGIRAATDENAVGGEYYGPDGFMELKGKPIIVTSNELSHSKINAKRLWKISEQLTKIKFDI